MKLACWPLALIPFAFALPGPTKSPKPVATKKAVTFATDIGPLVYAKCATCHHAGEGAPFSLTSYEDVKKRGKLIADVTQQRIMPPWHVSGGDYAFEDDRHLTDAQIALFQRWAAAGMPKGSASEMPAAPKFRYGFTLGKPDILVKMPKAFHVPANGPDIYRNFVLPLHLDHDVYVRAIDFVPGRRTVVHHSLFYYDASGTARTMAGRDVQPGFAGSMGISEVAAKAGSAEDVEFLTSGGLSKQPRFGSLGGWAVGAQPQELPHALAYFVPKGSDLLLSTHFHPSGKAEEEQSTVALYFAKAPPTKEFTALLMPPIFGVPSNIDIAPGDRHFTIKDSFTLPVDARIFRFGAHAHYLGKTMTLTATLPGGKVKHLLNIPDWDFNWQDQLSLKNYADFPKGTRLDAVIVYDNGAENPRNPTNPPKRVNWGQQTTDEMGSVIVWMVAQKESDLKVLHQKYLQHVKLSFIGFRPETIARPLPGQ